MNQGRIWCVVSPNVGLPLLLGSVTVISFVVHAAVMTHTTWMGNYWQGSSKVRTSENTALPPVAGVAPKVDSAFVVSIAPVAGTPGKGDTSFVVSVTPNPAVATMTTSANDATPKPVAVAAAATTTN